MHRSERIRRERKRERMKMRAIAHASFKVSDMGASLDYYCKGLGLKQKFTLANEQGQPWLTYLEVVPGQFLELFYDYNNLSPVPQTDNHIGYLHLSIEVEDIHAVKEELERKGLPITSDLILGPDYTYQFWTADPDGNRIEFMEYTKDSLQCGDHFLED